MSSLKQIKSKIRSIDKTRQVTKAMEAVSAVKMRKSQSAALSARPYATHALSILKRLSGTIDSSGHPLVAMRPVHKTGFIVVTSDRGLAGSLNSSVFREVHAFFKSHNLTRDSLGIITVGRKAYDHFLRRDFPIVEHFEHWGENVSMANPESLTRLIIELFLNNEYDEFYIAYTNFESTFQQNVVVRKVLPVSFEEVEKIVTGILPVRGKYAETPRDESGDRVRDYVFEPSAESVLDELVPFIVAIQLYHSQLEANASEHSARMVAMKNASDKGRDMSRELTLVYNKARQSAITREVSEIIGGIEAMN